MQKQNLELLRERQRNDVTVDTAPGVRVLLPIRADMASARGRRKQPMTEEFEAGCEIILQHLDSRQRLNGETGVVRSFQQATGSYIVQVSGEPCPLLFKPSNLRKVPSQCESPLMFAIMRGDYNALQQVFARMIDVHDWVDRTDPQLHLTPLIACAHIDDDATAVRLACRLLIAGAKVNTPDSMLGVRPVFSAAQEGKPQLLRLLVNRKAQLDIGATNASSTTPLAIASQNGYAECVSVLLDAGLQGWLRLTEAKNRDGKTPALIATERAHAKVLGVLAQGGADLRLATPIYYCKLRADDHSVVDRFDPSSDFPVHQALDMAVRSHVGKTCCGCGCNDGENASLMKCSTCCLAYFCSRACLKANWKSHKLVCKDIGAGRQLLGGSHEPRPARVCAGFEEAFGALDEVAQSDEYNRDASAKWEYDSGTRGYPNWQRYPARIEYCLESMSCMMNSCPRFEQAPKFMYRPGRPDNDGLYENHGRSQIPPPDVATRFVTFDDMTEREVYTGASRAVRRNGIRERPAPPADTEDDLLDLTSDLSSLGLTNEQMVMIKQLQLEMQ